MTSAGPGPSGPAGGSMSLLSRVRRRLRRQVAEPLDEAVFAPLRRWRNAGREYRPVFVGGASGSGTSFLSLSLGQHFDCAGVIYETNFQVARDSVLYVPDIDAFESVEAYQRHMTPKPDWSVERGRRDLLDMYRAYASGPSDTVIDKGPDINLLRIEFLAQCFPEGSFLLVFRDPVANVEGLRRKWKTFGREPLETTLRFYRDIHECFLERVETMPERMVAVEYERLVADHAGTLDEVGRRLGLRPARSARRLASSPNVEGRGIRNVRGGRIGVVRDANQRARERLAPAEVEAILDALGSLHERLRRSPVTVGA